MNNESGNNRNKDALGNSNVERDTVYNDRQEGMTDRNRNDHEKALIGIFDTEHEAINVIKRLKEIGYREDDITVIAKDNEKMERIDDQTDVDTEAQDDGSKVGAGAAIGGAVGGLAAALPALGLLAIPGIGPILAAGPIAVILGGAVAGGVAGGLIGALTEMGISDEDAKEYKHQIEQGKIIVMVENKDDLSDEVNNTYRQNNSILDGRSQIR
ncbi:MAG: general stress protein [Dethiosulfatibacter sp.]|nr:general stress protein [Dethiosulfatibacter sp.]